MSGALLRSGALKEFFALGAVGHPVYQSAAQLRVAMRNQIGADVADTFAVPKRNDTGDTIDWYAPHDGPVVPWTSATAEERTTALQSLQEMRERVMSAGQKLQAEPDSERQVFGRLLAHVMSFPDDQHVYLVNGKPVLTFWGFRRHDTPSTVDSLALLAVDPVIHRDAAAPVAAAPIAEPVATRRFPWWLWPLLLLLLLLLLLFWFRSCSELPTTVLPNLEGPTPPDVAVPREPVDRVGVRTVDERGDVYVGDRDGALLSTPDSGVPAGDPVTGEPPVEPAMPDGTDQAPPQIPELPPEETPADSEETPPELPPESSPEQEEGQPPPTPDQADQPPGPDAAEPPPLQLPPEALQQGKVDFLNGRWNSNSGLIDETGRPVQLEYDFKDGQGKVSLRRSDGSVCQGTAKASVDNSQLVIADQNQITCPDGQVFQPSTVDCSVGDSGRAECKGKYATGGDFPVEIRQAQ